MAEASHRVSLHVVFVCVVCGVKSKNFFEKQKKIKVFAKYF